MCVHRTLFQEDVDPQISSKRVQAPGSEVSNYADNNLVPRGLCRVKSIWKERNRNVADFIVGDFLKQFFL